MARLEENKKEFVRAKFASISKRYDLLNTVLSMQIDKLWRRQVVKMLAKFPSGWVLDLCAGTLPFALELTRQAKSRKVVAIDFCEEMLQQGVDHHAQKKLARILPVCGDGENIPLPDNSVWGCTVGFGVRNLADTARGIGEMHRVLKPGGKLLILEFSRPSNPVVKPVYNVYLNKILPWFAGKVSGDQEAYDYLASSIAAFFEPAELLGMMEKTGFTNVNTTPLTFGIVTVYKGEK